MAHRYEIGTRAWQPDVEEGWMASEVEEKKVDGQKVILVFRLANGEVWLGSRTQNERQTLICIQTRSVETTVTAIQDDNDSSLPPLMNPSILEAGDDLTNLSHLNEPAGMFESGFYAKTGP